MPGEVPCDRTPDRRCVMDILEFVLVTHTIAILWRTVFGSHGQRQ